MNSPVQKIKERLSIEEVVSSYIKLEKVGSNLKARCPFHNEKTPSFFVSADRGNYYCFGCGAKGDIFTFVQEFEGLDFRGALKLLAARAGVPLENYNPKEESEKEKIYRVMEEATKYFSENLSKNSKVFDYLKSRGLEEKTIKEFRLGFAKNEWRDLYGFLASKGFKDTEIEKAGLIKKVPDKAGYYDRFRGRVVFPIADSSGRVIAFSGRLFEDDGKSAKYLNSPDTPIFNKSYVLYGLDKAKDSIRKNNFSILVEGQFDLALSHQAGFRNTVATSGTALSDSTVSKENAVSSLGLILRLSNNILLAFDSDKAGISAIAKAGKIALSLGMDVKAVSMEEGFDPADLISKKGPDAWREVVRNSKHLIEFLTNRVLINTKGDLRKAGREIKEKVLPYVNAIDSAIEKSYFIKKISDLTQIPENDLREDLKKIEKELKYEKQEIEEAKKSGSTIFKKDYIEKRLLGIIFWQEIQKDQKIDVKKIFEKTAIVLDSSEDSLRETFKDSIEDLIFEAEIFYGNGEKLNREVDELILNLEEECLKEKLSKKMQELRIFEEKKEQTNAMNVLKEINDINKKIQEIKNGRLT
ncbi:MAG TPA: DNA primase [Candidatus Paceibacterota bacterium]|nr:DNA primase [Candidatus Paceibacterota bacterium]